MPFQKGNTINLGKKYSADRIERAVAPRRGSTVSTDTKRRLSESHRGISYSGRKSSPLSESHRAAISEGCRGVAGQHHTPHTEDTKRRISATMKGVKKGPGVVARMKIARMLVPLSKNSFNTKPEKAVGIALASVFPGLSPQREIPGARDLGLFHRCDFVDFESKLAVEVDGCYWHGCTNHLRTYPSRSPNDEKVNSVIPALGWRLLRIWEHDVKLFCSTVDELHRRLCDGTMTLLDVQACIRADWVACGRKIGRVK